MYRCLVSLMEQSHWYCYSGERGGGSSSGGSRGRLRPCVERVGVPEAMQLSSTGTSLRGPPTKDAKGDNPAVQC